MLRVGDRLCAVRNIHGYSGWIGIYLRFWLIKCGMRRMISSASVIGNSSSKGGLIFFSTLFYHPDGPDVAFNSNRPRFLPELKE